jgi:hypothetical protein
MQLNRTRVKAITGVIKVMGMMLIKEVKSGVAINFDLLRKENFHRFIPPNEIFNDIDFGSLKINKGKFNGSTKP